MISGKCPECDEVKEITQEGRMRGYCDDCYTKKYTCVVCNELVTDAWGLFTVTGIGNGHDTCLKPELKKKG